MKAYLIEMFGVSLAITLGVELAMALLWQGWKRKNPGGACRKCPGSACGKALLLVLLVNLLTNPPAVLLCWLARLYLPDLSQWLLQPVVEIAVVAAEAFVYCSFREKEQWRIRRPVAFAVSANVCSWLFGVLCMNIRRGL